MTPAEKKQHEDFREAKKIALTIGKGLMRRAADTNYCGCNIGGRMFVIGDSEEDIQNPNCIIAGKPAREVFGDFTVMW